MRTSPYSCPRNVRLKQNVRQLVSILAHQDGATVPKETVNLLEEQLQSVGESYEINPYTELLQLNRNSHIKTASPQIKLYFSPVMLKKMEQIALQTGASVRDVRLSLLLDAIQARGICFSKK